MRKIVMASLIASLALGAGIALAHGPMRHRVMAHAEGGPHMAFLAPLIEELGLTEDQRAAVHQLHEELMAQAKPLLEQHHQQMEEIESLLDADNPDAQEIGTRMIAAHATEQKIRAFHDANKDRFAAILTEEQRAKLKELEASHPQRDKVMMFHHGF